MKRLLLTLLLALGLAHAQSEASAYYAFPLAHGMLGTPILCDDLPGAACFLVDGPLHQAVVLAEEVMGAYVELTRELPWERPPHGGAASYWVRHDASLVVALGLVPYDHKRTLVIVLATELTGGGR